ncbi:hypothetical protein HAX54_048458 [Datura stramonium]|uniref:Uncharacterized protein n=1 Tax=Datura stramonium TaxID=4076 RepID=A0ABS8RHF1_DATST|nr:hypothetical protein [Datura stramonium]
MGRTIVAPDPFNSTISNSKIFYVNYNKHHICKSFFLYIELIMIEPGIMPAYKLDKLTSLGESSRLLSSRGKQEDSDGAFNDVLEHIDLDVSLSLANLEPQIVVQ